MPGCQHIKVELPIVYIAVVNGLTMSRYDKH